MSGIEQPQSKHCFRVVPTGLSKETADAVMKNVEDVDLDFKNNTLTVRIRQTVVRSSFDAIRKMVKTGLLPEVQIFDRHNSEPSNVLLFSYGTVIEHDFQLSYKENGTALHVIKWNFADVSIIPGDTDRPIYIEPAEVKPDPEWPTPEEAVKSLTK